MIPSRKRKASPQTGKKCLQRVRAARGWHRYTGVVTTAASTRQGLSSCYYPPVSVPLPIQTTVTPLLPHPAHEDKVPITTVDHALQATPDSPSPTCPPPTNALHRPPLLCHRKHYRHSVFPSPASFLNPLLPQNSGKPLWAEDPPNWLVLAGLVHR